MGRRKEVSGSELTAGFSMPIMCREGCRELRVHRDCVTYMVLIPLAIYIGSLCPYTHHTRLQELPGLNSKACYTQAMATRIYGNLPQGI